MKKKAEEIEQSGGEEKIAAKEITIRRTEFIIMSYLLDRKKPARRVKSDCLNEHFWNLWHGGFPKTLPRIERIFSDKFSLAMLIL